MAQSNSLSIQELEKFRNFFRDRGKETSLELFNALYSILSKNDFPDKINIKLDKHYSSSLRKEMLKYLGYKPTSEKISESFTIKKEPKRKKSPP